MTLDDDLAGGGGAFHTGLGDGVSPSMWTSAELWRGTDLKG